MAPILGLDAVTVDLEAGALIVGALTGLATLAGLIFRAMFSRIIDSLDASIDGLRVSVDGLHAAVGQLREQVSYLQGATGRREH